MSVTVHWYIDDVDLECILGLKVHAQTRCVDCGVIGTAK